MDAASPLVNKDQANDLLESYVHISNHMLRFVSSMSLKCAVELAIPDIIHNHGRPMTLPELITALHTISPKKTHCVRRLMRLLIHSGFFSMEKVVSQDVQQQDLKGYVLTRAGLLLLRDHPSTMTPYVLAILSPIMTKPWSSLSSWLQNDGDYDNPFHMAHGKTIWDFESHLPEFNTYFNEAMASDSRLAAILLTTDQGSKGLFERLDSLVDVGGGTGTMAMAIAQAYPQLKCTCFDLPHVVEGLKGTENLSFVGGDMFQAIPSGDAVLLKVGKERNQDEWGKLFMDAGFSAFKIVAKLDLRAIIEVYP
ncbi:hypothetical protein Ancab_013318 [Ancistrocladus abbreviatus]